MSETPPPAPITPAPTFSPDLPENWFLSGGDAFTAEADTLSRFKSTHDLAKSYIHLRKTGPAYPSEQSHEEDVARFRTLAQVPATPDGYGLVPPAELPAGMTFDAEATKHLAEVAHKHHVPAPALKALAEAQATLEKTRHAAAVAEAQAAEQRIQTEMQAALGANDTDRQRNAAQVNHLVKVLADHANIPPDDPHLAAFSSNPAAIRLLMQMSKMTQEDPTRAPGGYGDLRSNREKAEAIMSGKDPEWSSKYKDGDKSAVDRVMRLLSTP